MISRYTEDDEQNSWRKTKAPCQAQAIGCEHNTPWKRNANAEKTNNSDIGKVSNWGTYTNITHSSCNDNSNKPRNNIIEWNNSTNKSTKKKNILKYCNIQRKDLNYEQQRNERYLPETAKSIRVNKLSSTNFELVNNNTCDAHAAKNNDNIKTINTINTINDFTEVFNKENSIEDKPRSVSLSSSHNLSKTNSESNIKKLVQKNQTHFIINKICSTEFPRGTSTNEVLKIMLFLNEYLINSNILKDYYLKENKNILNSYSNLLAKSIKVTESERIPVERENNFPWYNSQDNVEKEKFEKARKIQNIWRKRKIRNFIGKRNEDKQELKKMCVNTWIEKGGFKMKKLIGFFNYMTETFISPNMANQEIGKYLNYTIKIILGKWDAKDQGWWYREYIKNIIYRS